MISKTFLNAIMGGLLIGTSASVLLLMNGRIAGISGIFNGILTPKQDDISWRVFFIFGLVSGAVIHQLVAGADYFYLDQPASFIMIAGGFLVGFGTRMGGGCTSGHGVCGLGRLSARSLVATICFIASAMLTLFILRHLGQLTW